MTVFLNNIKRLLKNKVQIGIMFILPFLPLLPIVLDSSPGAMYTINIGFIDHDKTNVTAGMREALDLTSNLIDINEEEIEPGINTAKIDYAIVIPKGYTDGIFNQKSMELQGYAKQEKNLSPIVRNFVDHFINPVKEIAKISNNDAVSFNIGFDSYKEQYLLEVQKEMTALPKGNTNIAWGMVIQFVMFSSIFASTLIVNDKENKTFFRSLYSPISLKSYMAQSILSFLVISLLQIYLIAAVLVYGFDMSMGESFLSMILLLSLVSLVNVSFGIAISSISKNASQSTMLGVGLITLMCMIGGAWGMKPTSELVINLGKLMPVTWMMQAIEKLTSGAKIGDITNHLLVLLVFVIIFFLLGTWRKIDIVK